MKTAIKYFSLVGMVFLALVVISASIDVFNRLVVGASLSWAQQAAVWFNLVAIFLIAPVMVVEEGHIKVAVIIDRLKGLTKGILVNINQIALLVFSVIALWAGISYTSYLIERETTRVLGMWLFPYWIVEVWLPIGMGLILISAIYKFLAKFLIKSRDEEKK